VARYKGRPSIKSIERDFPHMVEVTIPPGGLGKRLDAMYAFHAERGIKPRHGRGRRDAEGRDLVRWCFADPDTADDFALRFGGRRLIEPMPKDDPIALMEWAKRNIQGD
jgi:hypothetical protein